MGRTSVLYFFSLSVPWEFSVYFDKISNLGVFSSHEINKLHIVLNRFYKCVISLINNLVHLSFLFFHTDPI